MREEYGKSEEKGKIIEALKRKAFGETILETQEEYGFEDGEAVLKRRKITKKEVPPDMTAVRLLLEKQGLRDVSEMTDGELDELIRDLESALPESPVQKENT